MGNSTQTFKPKNESIRMYRSKKNKNTIMNLKIHKDIVVNICTKFLTLKFNYYL